MGQGQFETDAEYSASQGLLYLDDLKSARFGTGRDFRIWYTGGNARLVCADGDIQFNHATNYDTAEGGETFANQESMLHLEDNEGVKAYYNGVKKFETLSDGAKVHGKFELDGDLKLLNDKKLKVGYDDDLQIYHDTGPSTDASMIKNTTETELFISNAGDESIFIKTHGKNSIRCWDSSENYKVGLYHNDTLKFETTSGGVECKEDLKLLNDKKIKVGYDDDLQIWHDTDGDDFSNIKNTTEKEFYISNSGESIFIRADTGKNGIRLYADNDGADYEVVLYHGGDTEAFRTVSGGSKVTGDLEVTATVKPNEIKLVNDKKIKIGYNDDLQIYHDTGPSTDASMIKNTTETELFIVNAGDESIFIRTDSKNSIRCWDSSENYKVGLFYNDDLKLETTSGGAKITGTLESDEIKLVNDKKIKIGYDDDLQIYHDTTGDDFSTIKNTTAKQLFIANSNESIFIRANDGKDGVRCWPSSDNYKVGLFYDDDLKLETTSGGAKITGTLEADEIKLVNDKKIKIGYDSDLQIYHDTSPNPDASMIKNTTATQVFITNSNESIFIRANEGKDGVRCWPSSDSYKVGLFYDDTLKLETTDDGAKVTGDLVTTADLKPDGHIELKNDKKLKVGYDDDLQIYHDTDGDDFSTIKNTTAKQLFIANSNSDIFIRANDGKDGVRLHPSGENYKVELFYNDSLRFETTNAGAKITGALETTGDFEPDEIKLVNDKKIKIGYDDDLQIYHDTGPSPDASMIKNTTATQLFIANSNESVFIRANTGIDGVRCWDSDDSYKVGLFYDDDLKLQTQSTGVEILGDIRFDDNKKVSLGTGQDLDIFWDGSNSWFNQNGGYFQFNKDIWPRYGHDSGSRQDLGDGDRRWDDVYCDDTDTTSDQRYKDNIATSDLGLDFINKLTPRSYTKTHGTSGRTHYGLISQEVEKVITDSGKTTKEFGGIGISEGGVYSLRYNQFLSPLIKAVQELSAEVETLKAEVAALKSS